MGFECPTLMYAVSAWASSHLALRDGNSKDVSLRRPGYALARLQESMQQSELSTEMLVAVTMVLCSMECISEATGSWYPHLAGAAAALSRRPDSLRDPKLAVQSNFEGRWLLRNFAYHDVMTSVSLDRRPLVEGFYWASEDDALADSYIGFASRILFLISETSVLNADFVEGKAKPSTNAELGAHFFEDEAPFNPKGPKKRPSERARFLEEELKSWVCPSDQGTSPLALLGESYRNAALIHLYRTLGRHLNGYSTLLQSKIDRCVEAICMLTRGVSEGCLVECTLLFPLFMVGEEATEVSQIEIIREKLCTMVRLRKFRNVEACLDALDEVWRRRSDGSRHSDCDKVDWLDIVKHRDWQLSIS
ncbi:hypothetical protein QQX98_002782 [Neonectria punicea]|uniref:Uncharacterized protein n=1 Tax=Neonectria punicea TaxID=979145 RepID=A0ABR1HH65_9HYPO